MLLAEALWPRRADAAVVIGAGLERAASGMGHRQVAAHLGLAEGTVRGWLRGFAGRAEDVRRHFTVALAAPVGRRARPRPPSLVQPDCGGRARAAGARRAQHHLARAVRTVSGPRVPPAGAAPRSSSRCCSRQSAGAVLPARVGSSGGWCSVCRPRRSGDPCRGRGVGHGSEGGCGHSAAEVRRSCGSGRRGRARLGCSLAVRVVACMTAALRVPSCADVEAPHDRGSAGPSRRWGGARTPASDQAGRSGA